MASSDTEKDGNAETSPLSPHGESRQVVDQDSIDNDDSALLNFYLLVGMAEAIGISAIILVIIWMSHYRGGFAWDGSGKEFNYHPVFMVIGLVFLYGNGEIIYLKQWSTSFMLIIILSVYVDNNNNNGLVLFIQSFSSFFPQHLNFTPVFSCKLTLRH